VRSISDADINCAFSRRLGWRGEVRGDMNAASYAREAGWSKEGWGREILCGPSCPLWFQHLKLINHKGHEGSQSKNGTRGQPNQTVASIGMGAALFPAHFSRIRGTSKIARLEYLLALLRS